MIDMQPLNYGKKLILSEGQPGQDFFTQEETRSYVLGVIYV